MAEQLYGLRNPKRIRFYPWRYVAGGSVKHAVRIQSPTGAVCGYWVKHVDDWQGAGNEAEYAVLAVLPKCTNCKKGIA